MTTHQCNTCKGTYDPEQPGGYTHVCPPIPDKTMTIAEPNPNDPEGPPLDWTIVTKRKERLGHRDENWEQDDEGKRAIIAEGAGRIEI